MKKIIIILFILISVVGIAQTTNSNKRTDTNKEKELEIAYSIVDEIIVDCLGTVISDESGVKTVQLPDGFTGIDFKKSINKVFSKYPEIGILYPWTGKENSLNFYAVFTIYNCGILIFYFEDENNTCLFKCE